MLILPGSQAVISAVGEKKKKKKFRMLVSKTGKPPSFSPIPFPSIVWTVLENDAAKGETCKTTEYKRSKAIIQDCFYGTNTVLYRPSGGPFYPVHTLYRPSRRG